MFVTNLTKGRLGVDGRINLAPNEVNRYLPDTADLKARVAKLAAAHLVAVVQEPGLTKYTTGRVVKTVAADTAALSDAPRSKKVEVIRDEAEVEVKATAKRRKATKATESAEATEA